MVNSMRYGRSVRNEKVTEKNPCICRAATYIHRVEATVSRTTAGRRIFLLTLMPAAALGPYAAHIYQRVGRYSDAFAKVLAIAETKTI